MTTKDAAPEATASLQPASVRAILLKMDEVAAQGRPHGGSNRPYGFEADKVTIRESEALVIRMIASRFIAGESLRSIAMSLDAAGITTVKGRQWKTPTLAAMLTSGRIAGLREHHGVVVAKAVWEPIISEADRAAILAAFERRKPVSRGARSRYLLTGLLRCGRCGNVLFSAARLSGRRYVCMSGPDHGGCGKLAVVALPVESIVTVAVLARVAGLDPDAQRDLSEAVGLPPSLVATLLQLSSAEVSLGAAELALEPALELAWIELPETAKRRLMELMLEHVVVEGSRAGGPFDPLRVRPAWRS